MKVSGRNIKKRLYKLSLLKDEITRAKYYRGYGIHSPFVYGLIRKVFMCGKLYDSDNAPLYDALLSAGENAPYNSKTRCRTAAARRSA